MSYSLNGKCAGPEPSGPTGMDGENPYCRVGISAAPPQPAGAEIQDAGEMSGVAPELSRETTEQRHYSAGWTLIILGPKIGGRSVSAYPALSLVDSVSANGQELDYRRCNSGGYSGAKALGSPET